MGEFEEFKEIVKNSFKNFREHMDKLENELAENKGYIAEILELLKSLKTEVKAQIQEDYSPKEEISTGNQGVYSFIHSFTHSPKHILNTSIDPETLFKSFTNKEFLVFLTIFQLEPSQKVTYETLSQRLTLTTGCIRSYISSLIKKGAPLTKIKLNNKITILSIEKGFRTLTSEQKLISLYYQKDPNQQILGF